MDRKQVHRDGRSGSSSQYNKVVHNIAKELSDERNMKTGFSIKGKDGKMLFQC